MVQAPPIEPTPVVDEVANEVAVQEAPPTPCPVIKNYDQPPCGRLTPEKDEFGNDKCPECANG